MTPNEEILQLHVAALQQTVEQMSLYMHSMHDTLSSQNAGSNNQYSTTNFCGMQDVVAYLPFYVSPGTCNVAVYEEIGCNKYRPVQPVIEYSGQQLTLIFDSPRTGFVTVTHLDSYNPAMDQMRTPPIFASEPIALLQDIPPPTECAPLTEKTPVGSEVIQLDEQPFTIKNETAFAKAMGTIKTWPR